MTRPALRRFFRIDRSAAGVERAVEDELQFHFDMAMRDLMSQGMSPDDARREVVRRFGDVDRTRHNLTAIDRQRLGREQRAEWWSGFTQDVRYALRGLRRKPTFTAAVVLTLGLGIAANATMFGIIDRLLFRPPAMMIDADRVQRVYLSRTIDGKEFIGAWHQYSRYLDLTKWTTSFDRTAVATDVDWAVGVGESAKEMKLAGISATLWGFFDAKPVVGRFFTDAEDTPPMGSHVVVLSYPFWQMRYAGNANAVGQKLNIGSHVFTIIGVAPKGFNGTAVQAVVAFVPITVVGAEFAGGPSPTYHTTYNMSWLQMLARRKADVALDKANADLTQAYHRSYRAQIEIQPRTLKFELAKPRAVLGSMLADRGPNRSGDAKVAIWLVGVALVVLLIACANVGNLLLSRALQRRREIAVRVALGVSRSRLFTQLITESVVLAMIGGAAGIVITQWGGAALRRAMLPNVAWGNAISDYRLVAFATVCAIVAGLLAGLAPAVYAGRADVSSSLKAGTRDGAAHRSRLQSVLLVLQAALSVVLLVGAGLFVHSLYNVRTLPLGYDPGHVLWVSPEMRGVTLDTTARRELRNALAERAAAIPGVERAAHGVTVPFWSTWNDDIFVPGIDSASKLGEFDIQVASPGYFETVGTRILRGRGITAQDRAGAELVMVVSESMARTLWRDADPIGKCVRSRADTNPCRTVVGVAEDIRTGSLDEAPSMHYYMPRDQYPAGRGGIYVRTRGDAADLVGVVRRELQKAMPGAAYVNVTPLSNMLEPVVRSWKLGATMFSVFGIIALVLAAVGLYSVIAYNVTQRTHEMGVRVALGAQARDVVRLVVRDGVRVVAMGIVLGTTAALIAGRWVAPLLFKVSPKDPGVFAAVVITLLAVAVTASWLPALRASRVDPNVALRTD